MSAESSPREVRCVNGLGPRCECGGPSKLHVRPFNQPTGIFYCQRCALVALDAFAAARPARERALPFHALHHDAQDDQVAVGCYDIGVGLAVAFDGGGFTDPDRLRAFAADLMRAADWLISEEVAA